MPSEVQTCPKCGAMITPNLTRCRQCKAYLQGVSAEGALFDGLLPEALRGSPGTGLMMLALIVYYVIMVGLAGPDSLLGLTTYSVRQLGGVTTIGVLQGEYWRFATGMLGHGGLAHLAFNLYALTIVGPLVEELYDRKKMLVVFIVGGVLAMVISYLWYGELLGRVTHTSVGASGGTSALLGACLIGARRRGSEGRDVAQIMLRWTVFMLLFGIVSPGIDNAAHVGGWLVGAGFAAGFPLGINRAVAVNRVYSVIILGLLVGLVASVAVMLLDVKRYGARLSADAQSRTFLFYTYAEGTEPAYSSQTLLTEKCYQVYGEARTEPSKIDDAVDACERARRAWPRLKTFAALRSLYEAKQDRAQAEKFDRVVRRWTAR